MALCDRHSIDPAVSVDRTLTDASVEVQPPSFPSLLGDIAGVLIAIGLVVPVPHVDEVAERVVVLCSAD